MEANTTVRQVLQRKGAAVHAVAPDDTVLDALRALDRHDIGAVVVRDGAAMVGIFTERDYARKVILQGKASRDTKIRDVMTTDVVTVEPARTMGECMTLMTDRRIRHLPVVEDGRLCGLISIGDAVKAVMEEQRFVIQQLEGYIRGGAVG